jgi:hypothetical protein
MNAGSRLGYRPFPSDINARRSRPERLDRFRARQSAEFRAAHVAPRSLAEMVRCSISRLLRSHSPATDVAVRTSGRDVNPRLSASIVKVENRHKISDGVRTRGIRRSENGADFHPNPASGEFSPVSLGLTPAISRGNRAMCDERCQIARNLKLYGGASRDRTDDLIVANDALSQLSYSPTDGNGARETSAPGCLSDFTGCRFRAPVARVQECA